MTGSYDTGTHFYNTIITLNNLNVQDFTSPLTKIIDLSDIFINEHTHCSVFLSGFVFGWFKVERVIYVSPVGQQISDNQRLRHTFSTKFKPLFCLYKIEIYTITVDIWTYM